MDAYKPDYLTALQSNISGLMPQTNKYADLMMEDVERRRNPETEKTDRKQAANQALMDFGLALMSSKNPNFFGAVGEAGMPAVAGLKADLKDLKKEARDAIVDGAQAEGMKNTAARDLAGLTLQQAKIAADLQSGNLDRNQRAALEKLQRDVQWKIARLQESGADRRNKATLDASGGVEYRQNKRTLRDQAEASRDRLMALNGEFLKEGNPKRKAGIADQIEGEVHNMAAYNEQLKGLGDPGINWQPEAFRGYQTWAKTTNYVSPYASGRPQAQAPGRGPSKTMLDADAIISGQR